MLHTNVPPDVMVVGYWHPGALGATCRFHWPENRYVADACQ